MKYSGNCARSLGVAQTKMLKMFNIHYRYRLLHLDCRHDERLQFVCDLWLDMISCQLHKNIQILIFGLRIFRVILKTHIEICFVPFGCLRKDSLSNKMKHLVCHLHKHCMKTIITPSKSTSKIKDKGKCFHRELKTWINGIRYPLKYLNYIHYLSL